MNIRALLTLSALFPFAVSQGNATNETKVCKFPWLNPINTDTPVNSTGNVTFRWLDQPYNTQDWYFNVVVNFTSNDTFNHEQGTPYISAPDNTTVQVCTHKFGALNITATGNGKNGCEGVLSDKCIAFLKDRKGTVLDSRVKGFTFPCQNDIDFDKFEKECGQQLRNESHIGNGKECPYWLKISAD